MKTGRRDRDVLWGGYWGGPQVPRVAGAARIFERFGRYGQKTEKQTSARIAKALVFTVGWGRHPFRAIEQGWGYSVELPEIRISAPVFRGELPIFSGFWI